MERDKHRILFYALLSLFCLLSAGMIIAFTEALIARGKERDEKIIREALLSTGAMISQEIQRNISTGISATETLGYLMEMNAYSDALFHNWARYMVEESSMASTVQLAPEGVVRSIYPLEGNRGALGHDLLEDSRRDDGARKAISDRKTTVVGPVKLIQNGRMAVIVRKPLFIKEEAGEEFWGFAISLLYIEDILPKNREDLARKKLCFRLVGDDPDAEENPVFFSMVGFRKEKAVELPITVPNGRWLLCLSHKTSENPYYFYIRLTAAFFALGIAVYIFIQQSNIHRKSEEIHSLNKKLINLSLTDELTGIGNRRAGMTLLRNAVCHAERYNRKFCVVTIDLDYFKEVNDTYGHPAGDALLVHFTALLTRSLRKTDSVFRLGGDEFLLILPEISAEACRVVLDKLYDRIRQNPFETAGRKIALSASMGMAEYAADQTVETLMSRIDRKLYEAKEAGRNCYRC